MSVPVGSIVHFWCGGRDHLDSCSRVEAIGVDWVVLRHMDDGTPCVRRDMDRVFGREGYQRDEAAVGHSTMCPDYSRRYDVGT